MKLSQPIPVYNIDGTLNEASSMMEAVSLILRYRNYLERTTFAVSSLGKQKLILGHSWLRQHNPEINWATGDVKMSRCPPRCCPGCQDEVRQEHTARKAEIRRTEACSNGPAPSVHHDSDSEMDLSALPSLDEGDHILATSLLPSPSMDIRVTSSILQRLAEAF